MKSYCITGKRIRKVNIPNEFDICKIQIGILVKGDEAEKVGLFEQGDIVLPFGNFGAQSRKNAYGYTYADKEKQKERRYVSTNWVYPFGNTNASMVAADIYKQCYPKVVVPPCGIELQLYQDENGQKFVIADLTDEIREKYLKETINLFLEIYGHCYIFDESIQVDNSTRRQRCNWEILPAGELPSKHIKKQLAEHGQKTDTYSVFRLEYMETFKSEKVVEGINGFNGYYAYVFTNYCVLESAVYGNATYIIPKENWEVLSQKTKRELFNEKKVIAKLDHTEKWQKNIEGMFNKFGIA